MIETIFSNENGDDRTSKAGTAFKMPKNIRQVGKSSTARKIYVEDYVMSFIKQLAGGDFSGCAIAVLVGESIKLENCRNIFISGAVKVNDADIANDIVFTNDTWTSIYEEIKKYFVDTEIVGWFIGGPGYLLSEDNKIQKIHIDNFAGQDKVLLTFDNLEKEEAFLCYENNCLTKQDGFYIYYEKNEDMQNYIIDHKQLESCDADYSDKVSKDIRTVIQNKKPVEEDTKSITRLMYAAGTLLAIILLIIGAAMLGNYDQMKSMQETLNHLSKNIESSVDGEPQSDKSGAAVITQAVVTKKASSELNDSKGSNKDAANDKGLDVEVVPGNVEPLKKEATTSNKESKENDKGSTSDKELVKDSKATDQKSDADSKKENKKVNKPKTDKKASSSKTNKKASSSNTAKNSYTYYTVGDGDTLADISYKLYGSYTKVKKIMKLNGIDDQDLIYAGKKLKVPQ